MLSVHSIKFRIRVRIRIRSAIPVSSRLVFLVPSTLLAVIKHLPTLKTPTPDLALTDGRIVLLRHPLNTTLHTELLDRKQIWLMHCKRINNRVCIQHTFSAMLRKEIIPLRLHPLLYVSTNFQALEVLQKLAVLRIL